MKSADCRFRPTAAVPATSRPVRKRDPPWKTFPAAAAFSRSPRPAAPHIRRRAKRPACRAAPSEPLRGKPRQWKPQTRRNRPGEPFPSAQKYLRQRRSGLCIPRRPRSPSGSREAACRVRDSGWRERIPPIDAQGAAPGLHRKYFHHRAASIRRERFPHLHRPRKAVRQAISISCSSSVTLFHSVSVFRNVRGYTPQKLCVNSKYGGMYKLKRSP